MSVTAESKVKEETSASEPNVAAAIEQLLLDHPGYLNAQLRPEEELAKNLEVTLREVRTSLRRLTERGILVRKRGRGTYVRRLPIETEFSEAGQSRAISPELLIREPDAGSESRAARMHRMPQEARWLQLGLWSDLYNQAHPNQELLNGMLRRVETLGHDVSLRSLTCDRGIAMPTEELTQRIQRMPCDGYIVVKYWADHFEKAIGNLSVPTVWYQTSSIAIDREPMVMFNTMEATERAIRHLAERGYERIALLNQENTLGLLPMGAFDVQAYHQVLDRKGLTYRSIQESSVFSSEASLNAASKLLAEPKHPQAVYVADDHLLPGLLEAARRHDLRIGEDLAVITLSNRGAPLPPGYNWSRMEFDPFLIGQTIVDVLVKRILGEEDFVPIQSFHARWVPGNTH